jgi:hypothetical protein
MVPRFVLLVLVAVASPVISGAAGACSPQPGYVRPSNFELVQLTPVIAIGTAVREMGNSSLPGVEFKIESSLKGEAPQTIVLPAARFGDVPPSNSAMLPEPHPHAMHGMCNRITYHAGGRYLLFLDRSVEGSWHEPFYPFSRVNEDYAGEDDAWTRAVRRYLRLQTRKPGEALKALNRMVETGVDPAVGPLSKSELADIKAHLSLPSPFKSTAYLLEMWRVMDSGIRPSGGSSLLAAPIAQDLIDLEGGVPARIWWKRFLLGSLVVGDHKAAAPLFDSLITDRRTDPRLIGPVLRFEARHGRYARAFAWIENRLLAILPTLSGNDARQLIYEVVLLQTNDFKGPAGKEAWRSDSHAVSAWPELALALYWYQARFLDREPQWSFADYVALIPIANYRERPEVTLALVNDYGESKVSQWAIAELEDEEARRAWEQKRNDDTSIDQDPAYLPLRILVSSKRSDHEAELLKVFCQSAARRELLIALFGRYGSDAYWQFFDRLAATSSLTLKERRLLAGASALFSANHLSPGDEIRPWFSERVIERIDAAMGKTPVKAEPINCPR